MNFHVLTLFPDFINDGTKYSIIGRAKEKGIINVNTINIRDFACNKHNQVDDYPYGGGAGMVLRAEPVYKAFNSVKKNNAKFIYLTPKGKPFNQKIAAELAEEEEIIILCGHYEGIDERVIEELMPYEISLGDYIVTGGELGALIVIDAVSRLVKGVLGSATSTEDESFSHNLLEYPQYTRPQSFLGREVPEVLLSGNHGEVHKWRKEESVRITKEKRPDLLL